MEDRNKRKIKEVVKYLIYQKGFIVENNTWEKKGELRKYKESNHRI